MSGALTRLGALAIGRAHTVQTAARLPFAAAPALLDGAVTDLPGESPPDADFASHRAPGSASRVGPDSALVLERAADAGRRGPVAAAPTAIPNPTSDLAPNPADAPSPAASVAGIAPAQAPPRAPQRTMLGPSPSPPGATPAGDIAAIPPFTARASTRLEPAKRISGARSDGETPERPRPDRPGARLVGATDDLTASIPVETASVASERRTAPPTRPDPAAPVQPSRPRGEPAPLLPQRPSERPAAPSSLGPVAPAPRAGAAEAAPEVHVHIGRIEVTAVQGPAPAKRAARRGAPTMSLDDYLARRREGER
jgi:hypothetical protein